MKVYKLRTVAAMLQMSKKAIKRALFAEGVITKSLAIRDAKGLVVEQIDFVEVHIETTLLITEFGVEFLKSVQSNEEDSI